MSQRNPFGHPPNCQCEHCQDWRDEQLGVAALANLTAAKSRAKRVVVTCPNCETGLDAPYKFCPQCGYQLQRRCPDCDRPCNPGFKFCGWCGTELDTEGEGKKQK